MQRTIEFHRKAFSIQFRDVSINFIECLIYIPILVYGFVKFYSLNISEPLDCRVLLVRYSAMMLNDDDDDENISLSTE